MATTVTDAVFNATQQGMQGAAIYNPTTEAVGGIPMSMYMSQSFVQKSQTYDIERIKGEMVSFGLEVRHLARKLTELSKQNSDTSNIDADMKDFAHVLDELTAKVERALQRLDHHVARMDWQTEKIEELGQNTNNLGFSVGAFGEMFDELQEKVTSLTNISMAQDQAIAELTTMLSDRNTTTKSILKRLSKLEGKDEPTEDQAV
jgi:DNA repair ATPase RecN